MTTVFISGSRKISRLNDLIRERLDNIISKRINIIVGDASGADKAMQSYLAEKDYKNVTVYCAGDHCRNNVGTWTTRFVNVDSNLKGRDFYAQKDKEMAWIADIGFVLWDGKSAGSVANILELVKGEKKVVVYYSPERQFCNLRSVEDIDALLKKCEPKAFDSISRKVKLKRYLREIRGERQTEMPLH